MSQTKEYFKEWRLNNKDKVNESTKKYRLNNKEKIKDLKKESNKRFKLKNKEYFNIYYSEYRKSDKWIDYFKKYNHTPEAIIINRARDISREKVSLTDKECELCGSQDNLHRHHNNYNNPMDINILCCDCHHEWHKNNKPIYPTTPSSIKGLLN